MCSICGCGADPSAAGRHYDHDHDHDHGADGHHAHAHDHDHDQGHDHHHQHADRIADRDVAVRRGDAGRVETLRADAATPRMIRVEQDILAENSRLAAANRAFFVRDGITAINLMSGPGSGKTTLLVRSITDLASRLPVAVIEGDQETSFDAERIRATGAPALQVNTGNGCHLDARMIGRALPELAPAPGALLFIENVGNLVCPAAFDLGEASRVVLLSVTEGDDKPLKYAGMFAAADLMLITKIDLAPYVPFDVERCRAAVRRINPGIGILEVSALTGAGLDAWYGWLNRRRLTPTPSAEAGLADGTLTDRTLRGGGR